MSVCFVDERRHDNEAYPNVVVVNKLLNELIDELPLEGSTCTVEQKSNECFTKSTKGDNLNSKDIRGDNLKYLSCNETVNENCEKHSVNKAISKQLWQSDDFKINNKTCLMNEWSLQLVQESSGIDFLPDLNNNANQSDEKNTPPRPKSREGNVRELSPLPLDISVNNTHQQKAQLSASGGIENERLSLSGLIRYLATEEEILDIKHFKDLEYVWNSVKPDKKEGKQMVAMETVVREEFNIVIRNALEQLKTADLEQNNDTKWQQVKLILNVAWIISDSNTKLCLDMTKNLEILNNMCVLIKKIISCDEFETKKNLTYIIKAFLGILHNICRNNSNSREILRQCAFLSVLLRLSKTKISMIRAKCLIVMSYIVNDSEIHIISTDSKVLIFIVDILKNAHDSPDHMSYKYGMNVSEVLQGLYNLLANDENKESLMSLEIIDVYLEILTEKFSDEEVCLAVNGVWKLSFHKSNKQKMKSKEQLIKVLHSLQSSDIEDIKHAARGALWEMNQQTEGPNLNTNSVHLDVDCPHIMVSYQWDSQPVMLKVKDKLKHAGYKVWMDVEHMTGSTLEAMALAVEKAAVVLIGMSQKYKDSPSCRSEAEYTYKLRKSFIPLRLQHQYVPDGWLGMLIGTRLYFDISNEDRIDQQMDNIIKELGSRGKTGVSKDQVDGYSIPNHSCVVPRYESWSAEDVSTWIHSSSVYIPENIMKEIDGSLLKELITVQDRAPEHFYRLVQTEFKLDVINMLKFSKLLRELNR